MRYLRTYPWVLQMLLFFLMFFTFQSAGTFLLLSLLSKISGVTLSQLKNISPASPQQIINTDLIVEGLFNLFIFMLPAFIFAYLSHPSPSRYLGLRRPGKPMQIVLVICIMLGIIPLLSVIEELMSKINFNKAIRDMQKTNDDTFEAFLSIHSFSAFLRVFVLMAIVPAFGEEMFFRGVLMRLTQKRSNNIVISVAFSALIFTLMHMNFYGFVSIFIAGSLLAVIYILTGSLWYSIIGHLFFNGTQVVLAYAGRQSASIKVFMESNTVPVYLVIGGTTLFAIAFYLLIKNRTPLPATWPEDFDTNDRQSQDTWLQQ